MKPFYDRDGVTLYHADCRDVLWSINPRSVALLCTDPPYGVKLQTNYKTARKQGKGLIRNRVDYPPIFGDDRKFDPSHLLVYPRAIIFGGNYFADRLPPSPSWLVWDKLDRLETLKREIGFNCQADLEMAWTNLGGPARIFPHRWAGLLKASERRERRCHPTQKPIALMAKLLDLYTKPGDLVLDPYAGSGSTLIAARNLGRRAIGVEYSKQYCNVIVRRLEQLRLAREAA